MAEFIEVKTTVSSKETAEKLSNEILNKKLAACIQIIGPVESKYWWKGKIEEDKELVLIIKSKASLYKELEKTILKLHPYEEPEIVVIPILEGSKGYLNWILNSTQKNSSTPKSKK